MQTVTGKKHTPWHLFSEVLNFFNCDLKNGIANNDEYIIVCVSFGFRSVMRVQNVSYQLCSSYELSKERLVIISL
jgi:hypothetical protein